MSDIYKGFQQKMLDETAFQQLPEGYSHENIQKPKCQFLIEITFKLFLYIY